MSDDCGSWAEYVRDNMNDEWKAMKADRDKYKALADAAWAECEAARELLSARGSSRLIDVAQNIPWFDDYARARIANDAARKEHGA